MTADMDNNNFFRSDLPMAPLNVHVDGVTRDSVTLRWEAPRDTGGVPLSGYIIEQRDGKVTSVTESPALGGRWRVAAYVDPSRTWWTVAGLIQGCEYSFRIRAENPDGAGAPCSLPSSVIPRSMIGEKLLYSPPVFVHQFLCFFVAYRHISTIQTSSANTVSLKQIKHLKNNL